MQYLITPEIALNRLNEIKAKLDAGMIILYGICTEFVGDYPYSLRNFMTQAGISWSDWPKFSGNIYYPIRILEDTQMFSKDIDPMTLYNLCSNKDLWSINWEYGRNRRELLDWLIEQFTLVIKNKELNNV